MALPPGMPAHVVHISSCIKFTDNGEKLVPTSPAVHREQFPVKWEDLGGNTVFAVNADERDGRVAEVRGEDFESRESEEAHERETTSDTGCLVPKRRDQGIIIENMDGHRALQPNRVAVVGKTKGIAHGTPEKAPLTKNEYASARDLAHRPASHWRPWTPVDYDTGYSGTTITDGQDERGGYEGDDEDEDDWSPVAPKASPTINAETSLARLAADNAASNGSEHGSMDNEKASIDVVDCYLKDVKATLERLDMAYSNPLSSVERPQNTLPSSGTMRAKRTPLGIQDTSQRRDTSPMLAPSPEHGLVDWSSCPDWPLVDRSYSPIVPNQATEPTVQTILWLRLPDLIDKWETLMQHLEELAQIPPKQSLFPGAFPMARLGRKLDRSWPVPHSLTKWDYRSRQLKVLYERTTFEQYRLVAGWLLDYMPRVEPQLEKILIDVVRSKGPGILKTLLETGNTQEAYDDATFQISRSEKPEHVAATVQSAEIESSQVSKRRHLEALDLGASGNKPLPPLPIAKPPIPPKSPRRARLPPRNFPQTAEKSLQRASESLENAPRTPTPPLSESELDRWLTPREAPPGLPEPTVFEPPHSYQSTTLRNEMSIDRFLLTRGLSSRPSHGSPSRVSVAPTPPSPSKVRPPPQRSALRREAQVSFSQKLKRQVAFHELIKVQREEGSNIVQTRHELQLHRDGPHSQNEQKARLEEGMMNKEEGEALKRRGSLTESFETLKIGEAADDSRIIDSQMWRVMARWELQLRRWEKGQGEETDVNLDGDARQLPPQRLSYPEDVRLQKERER